MPSLGGLELVVIAVVALLVFGPKRLPEVSRQVGGALRELRRVQTQVKSEIDDALRIDDAAPARPPRAALDAKPIPTGPPADEVPLDVPDAADGAEAAADGAAVPEAAAEPPDSGSFS